jgi:pimeloyl-ACP methyl ester carboxylesterase
MELFYRELGGGEPIIILHGLYGSSDNWISVGRQLSDRFRVILVDQRNHGRSPHSQSHTYHHLAQDLLELTNRLELSNATLVGHSMGGKTAMQFAALYPNLVKALVVVDILPTSYRSLDSVGFNQEKVHRSILSTLSLLRPEMMKTREEIDNSLANGVSDRMVRQFLMKSIKRDEKGVFSWILNVEGLIQNLDSLMDRISLNDELNKIAVPTLFIKGETSGYINKEGEEHLNELFSNFKVEIVENAGHWLHAENPVGFMKVLNNFLKEIYTLS